MKKSKKIFPRFMSAIVVVIMLTTTVLSMSTVVKAYGEPETGYYWKDDDGKWHWEDDGITKGFDWVDVDGNEHYYDNTSYSGVWTLRENDTKLEFCEAGVNFYEAASAGENPNAEITPDTEGLGGFVTRLYSVVLGRQPDNSGYKTWCAQLKTGDVTGREVADGFLDSKEFISKGLSDGEYIDVLYKVFFNREADSEGRALWVSQLASGVSREDIRDGFYNSTEWANTCISYGIRSGGNGKADIEVEPSEGMVNFVKALYSECLGREADEDGLKEWTTKLALQELSGKQVAYGFVFSKEFKDKTSKMEDDEIVKIFYTVFLNREPDDSGLFFWKSRMVWGDPIIVLFDGFADSAEFARKCNKYGIIVGDHIDVEGFSVEPAFIDFVTSDGSWWGFSPMDAISLLDSTDLSRRNTYTEYAYLGSRYSATTITIPESEFKVLEKFAADHFGPDWTPGMKVVYTAWWITKNSDYANGSDWNIIGNRGYADAIINCHLGQCAQYNGCLLEMMAWLGYDVNMIFVPRAQGGGWQHYWCDVKIDGKYYYMDAGNESHSNPVLCYDYEDSGRFQYRPGLGIPM